MEMVSLEQDLKENSYPGRGIVIGTLCGRQICGYRLFHMAGRSENSRKPACLLRTARGIRTQAFDPAKVKDPSLIIYAPVRVLGNKTIVDQRRPDGYDL